MLSKNKIKLINLLRKKKYRQKYQLFVAEGEKIVNELINSSFDIEFLVVKQNEILNFGIPDEINTYKVDENLFNSLSNLQAPQAVFAVVQIPEYESDFKWLMNNLTLYLDNIQDPGNLGTIIRISNWFGINRVICSENTVDVYNPKVIQATMGAFLRVKIYYKNLQTFERRKLLDLPIYGAYLDGEDIYQKQLTNSGIIVLGNEANGISNNLDSLISDKIKIPPFPDNNKDTESLNVAVSAGIICAEFRRRILSEN